MPSSALHGYCMVHRHAGEKHRNKSKSQINNNNKQKQKAKLKIGLPYNLPIPLLGTYLSRVTTETPTTANERNKPGVHQWMNTENVHLHQGPLLNSKGCDCVLCRAGDHVKWKRPTSHPCFLCGVQENKRELKGGMLSKWKEVVKVKEGKINLGLNTSMCTVCMETRI